MRVTIVLLITLIYHPFISSSHAYVCQNEPEVTVLSEDMQAVEMICSASQHALAALAHYDLRPKRPITIEVIEQGLDHNGYLAYGSYDSRSDRIKVMSYKSILSSDSAPQMYDELFDTIHYSGAVAHEIAHAVFHQHTTALAPGTAPQEYLAHAIQLSVMPEDRRNDIIEKMNVSAWMSGDAISDIYMALEPGRFAVKSYKHLTTTNDPKGFIRILLNAKWFYVYIP